MVCSSSEGGKESQERRSRTPWAKPDYTLKGSWGFRNKEKLICACEGSRFCTRENPAKQRGGNPIPGIHGSWVGDTMFAMARPWQSNVREHSLVDAFNKYNIGMILNLQEVGEHDGCGPGNLPHCGFSYNPETFTAAGIGFYNFSWRDMGVPSIDLMMDIVQVMAYVQQVDGRRIAVHCHAGLGRTGLAIACYLVYAKLHTAETAVTFVRENRPGALQTKTQVLFVSVFEQYIAYLRCNFKGPDVASIKIGEDTALPAPLVSHTTALEGVKEASKALADFDQKVPPSAVKDVGGLRTLTYTSGLTVVRPLATPAAMPTKDSSLPFGLGGGKDKSKVVKPSVTITDKDLALDQNDLPWNEQFHIKKEIFYHAWIPDPPTSYHEALHRQQRVLHGQRRRTYLHLHIFLKDCCFAIINAADAHEAAITLSFPDASSQPQQQPKGPSPLQLTYPQPFSTQSRPLTQQGQAFPQALQQAEAGYYRQVSQPEPQHHQLHPWAPPPLPPSGTKQMWPPLQQPYHNYPASIPTPAPPASQQTYYNHPAPTPAPPALQQPYYNYPAPTPAPPALQQPGQALGENSVASSFPTMLMPPGATQLSIHHTRITGVTATIEQFDAAGPQSQAHMPTPAMDYTSAPPVPPAPPVLPKGYSFARAFSESIRWRLNGSDHELVDLFSANHNYNCFVAPYTDSEGISQTVDHLKRLANYDEFGHVASAPLLAIIVLIDSFFASFDRESTCLSPACLVVIADNYGQLQYEVEPGPEAPQFYAAVQMLEKIPLADQELLLLMSATLRHVARASWTSAGFEEDLVDVGRWMVRLMAGVEVASHHDSEEAIMCFLWYLLKNDVAYASFILIKQRRTDRRAGRPVPTTATFGGTFGLPYDPGAHSSTLQYNIQANATSHDASSLLAPHPLGMPLSPASATRATIQAFHPPPGEIYQVGHITGPTHSTAPTTLPGFRSHRQSSEPGPSGLPYPAMTDAPRPATSTVKLPPLRHSQLSKAPTRAYLDQSATRSQILAAAPPTVLVPNSMAGHVSVHSVWL